MADNILTRDRDLATLDIAAKEIGTVKYPRNILVDPSGADVPPATETTLAALLSAAQAIQAAANALNTKTTAVNTGAISGTVSVSNFPAGGTGLTDTELRASPLSVTGNFYQATQPVSFTWAGLTDSQLRASPVPVSFTQTGLTDAQLRASAVPVSVGNFPSTQAVTGTFWQATQPVSAVSLPLPSGAATETSLAALQPLLSTIAGTIALHNAPFVDGAPGQLMLAKRRDSDTTTVADGDLNTLNLDEEGRLKVASKPASYSPIVGNITSATSTVFTLTERFSNLMVHCAGTFAGVNCTFEGSLNSTNGVDGSWFAVQAIRSNANTIETTTGVLAAAPAYAWELSVNALKYFRIRATAWTSGTQVWTLIPGTYATEPIPGAQISGTQPVSFTQPALVAGTAAIGTVGPTAPATPYILNSAASTNEALILTGTSGLHAFYATNTGATVAFVKLYNKATAPISTDVPAMVIPVPAAVSGVPGVATLPIGFSGFRFALGLGIRITGAVADTDTTAVTAGQVKVMLSRTV
jgi:hypothetical protein